MHRIHRHVTAPTRNIYYVTDFTSMLRVISGLLLLSVTLIGGVRHSSKPCALFLTFLAAKFQTTIGRPRKAQGRVLTFPLFRKPDRRRCRRRLPRGGIFRMTESEWGDRAATIFDLDRVTGVHFRSNYFYRANGNGGRALFINYVNLSEAGQERRFWKNFDDGPPTVTDSFLLNGSG